jgi:hypothetical protein
MIKIFQPKKEEMTGERRKLYNEALHNLNPSNVVRVNKLRRMCSMHGGVENAFKILVRKPKGKRPLRRPGVHGIISKWILTETR